MKPITFTRIITIMFLGCLNHIAHAEVYGFNPPPKDFHIQGTPLTVKSMPPLMKQGTLGICYAAAAATLLTAENCRATKTDCSSIPDEKIFSVIGLSQWETEGLEQEFGQRNRSISIGGNAINVISAVLNNSGVSPSERCVSLDKITKNVGGASFANTEQEKFWQDLKKQYTLNHKKAVDCPACFLEAYPNSEPHDFIKKHLTLSNPDSIADRIEAGAFSEKTYEDFLWQLLLPKACSRISKSVQLENFNKISLSFWPLTKDETGTFSQALKNIKRTLSRGRPLALGNLCLDKSPKTIGHCEFRHAVVISGYELVCSASGKKCIDALKVVNSWGAGWQKENNDGWVLAKPLLDRTSYDQGTLAWLTDMDDGEE